VRALLLAWGLASATLAWMALRAGASLAGWPGRWLGQLAGPVLFFFKQRSVFF
jgi:hypothetical protein